MALDLRDRAHAGRRLEFCDRRGFDWSEVWKAGAPWRRAVRDSHHELMEGLAAARRQNSAQGSGPATRPVWLVVAAAFVFYAARMFLLISRHAVNIFFWDQWAFNDATLFQQHSLWQMFAWQHGPHRLGLGALFQKLVDPYFAWNSRIESFVIGAVIVAAATCAFWLKRRLYGPFTVFDVVIPAIVFTPRQWETLFSATNFAHGPLPLLLVLLYCLSWTCGRGAVRYPLILLINFVTIYTGFGLFLGVLTPFLLLVDRWFGDPEAPSRAYFVGTLLIAFASLGSFFVGYRFDAAIECFSFQPHSPGSYLSFVGLMFAYFFALNGTGVAPRLVGIAILCLLVVGLAIALWRLLRRQVPSNAERNRLLAIVTLIAFSLLFCMNTAYGRACAGLGLAHNSRYSIYLEPALLGAYFCLLTVRQATTRNLLLAGMLLPVLAASLHIGFREMNFPRDVKLRWKTCYLQTEDIKHCDQVAGPGIYPEPTENAHLQEKLQYLKKTRQNLYSDSK